MALDLVADDYINACCTNPVRLEAVEVLVSILYPGAVLADLGCGTGMPEDGALAVAGIQVV